MNHLITAITNKLSGSALSTSVGGRIYLDRAPQGAVYPHVVFFIVSGVPERTFTEEYENVLIQFSLFSASKSATEITTMYANLDTLFDECALTITGSTLVRMSRRNLTTMVEDIQMKNSTVEVKHWAIDFEVKTSLN